MTASEGQWIIYCNLMQGGLSHINVIHQGSNSPLAQQEQFHSGYVLRLRGFRLGANLDLQPVGAQHLIGFFCPSVLFNVSIYAPAFSVATMPVLTNLVCEIEKPALISLWLAPRMIHENQGDLTGVKPRLLAVFPWHRPDQSQRSSSTGLTCEDSQTEDEGDAGWRKRQLKLVRYSSTPHFKCLKTCLLLIIYDTKVVESGVLAGSWNCFTRHQQKSSTNCPFSCGRGQWSAVHEGVASKERLPSDSAFVLTAHLSNTANKMKEKELKNLEE